MAKVVKFGGSSLASAEQFQKVGDIIRADKQRRFVVPSAPGKRFSKDTKVTDMLYACYDLAAAGKPFSKELKEIRARYDEIIEGLMLELSLEDEFKTIEKNFKATDDPEQLKYGDAILFDVEDDYHLGIFLSYGRILAMQVPCLEGVSQSTIYPKNWWLSLFVRGYRKGE